MGSTLYQFKSEVVSRGHPRGKVDVRDCVIELEGMKQKRFFTFRLVDAAGAAVLRLSTQDRADGERWVQVLESAGCPVEVTSRDRDSRVRDSRRATSASETSAGPAGEQREQRGAEWPASAASDSATLHGEGGPAPRAPMRGSTPMHKQPRFSLLSSERLSYEKNTGLVNLGMVIIVATHTRLIIENLMKYGLRIERRFWVSDVIEQNDRAAQLLLLLPAVLAFCLAAFGVEVAASKGWLGGGPTLAAHTVNAAAALLLPLAGVWRVEGPPVVGFIVTMFTVIGWMKIVSYAHCNHDLRLSAAKGEILPGNPESHETIAAAAAAVYPENVTLRDFAYFLAAPTLTYQVAYPRSSRVRKIWLLRRAAELLVYCSLMLFIIEQYIYPTMDNAIAPLDRREWVWMAERVLKLSVPWLYVWLCSFYCLFHLWANIVAELLMFGDREFYKGWWNATTIIDYWRWWNMPVHKWMLRTLYFPVLNKTRSKVTAILVVFLTSAVFHELLVAVPVKMLKGWAFVGMLIQAPLIYVTSKVNALFRNDQLGNVLFWCSFCFLGQPVALLLYYKSWREGVMAHTVV